MFTKSSRVAAVSIATGLFTLATIQLWSLAVHAKPLPPEYRVPGNCVTTTEFRDDGTIVERYSCELTKAQAKRLKETGK